MGRQRVTVFGPTGKVGRQIVEFLLENDYEVVAFVHNTPLERRGGLKIINGDVHSKNDVEAALKGATAAVSALGSWSTEKKDVLSSAMSNIIPTMEAYGIERIVSLTGADARDINDKPGIINRLSKRMLNLAAGRILKDGEEHIKLLRVSRLEWTVIRSPVMRSFGPRGYTLNNELPKPWQTIHRRDVALAMVEQLENNDCIKMSPFIH